ncbi:TPA: hypothetical protein R7A29_001787 [Klebsiella pneumoniae]|nr:hypothetical protein [Klebsiella pneumoniae]MDZ0144282.1 hypothetical protein [Klebsiella pneumoniae]MDZ0270012.1 hypothetical protein [Klebsiella pneumoniae]MDZ0288236.1 hypothetical protein [Klebsiella pneumoniae]HEE1847884.1 hypothetical protein [Klebsiella pneumoniae]
MNISEAIGWVDFIYQIAREDKVEGGTGGVANLQAKQLADRTQFLKMLIESISDYREYTFIKTEADPDGTITGLASTPAGKMFRVAQSGAEVLSFRYYLNNSGVAEEVTGLLGRGSITNNIRTFDSLSLAEEDLSVGNILPGARVYIRSADNSAIADEYINNDGTLEKTGEYIPSKDGVVKPTDEYRDGVTYAWGKVMESGEMLPGTLQGMDGLPAPENVAAYAAKGVAVYQLNPADVPAGHAIVKDGIVLLEVDQSGRLNYLPPLNRRARQSVNQRPDMVLTPLPAAVRAAVEPLALRACKYMLSAWVPTWVPLAGGTGLPATGSTMDSIEQYPLMLAAVVHWISWCDAGYATWDEAFIGVSYDTAVSWIVQGLDLVVSAHLANGGWWGGPPPPWSEASEDVAVTFGSQAAELARNVASHCDLMAAHLTAAHKAKVTAMVVHEANRFVKYTPKYRWTRPDIRGQVTDNYPTGDSKSEEIAWNLAILARALILAPDNANAERWAERLITMQIAALGDRNDLSETMTINGLAPCDVMNGTNVNPTRLVENHGVADGQDVSRWYTMASLSGSEWMLRTFLLAGKPVPSAALWHMADTLRALAYNPDGSVWSMDWREPVGELSYAPAIAYMFADPRQDYIDTLLHRLAIFAGQQDDTTGALPAGAFNWPVYGSSQPGEFLSYIRLSDRMLSPLTCPRATNAHYTSLAAIYRSV